jgi:hypothetical protein
MASRVVLTVPGFNGGDPIALAEFEVSSGLRATGGGRTGRIAGWTGRFELVDAALAPSLADHLDRTFEEGHTGVAELVEDGPDGRFRFDGVAVRHRGGVKFAFDAFARVRS